MHSRQHLQAVTEKPGAWAGATTCEPSTSAKEVPIFCTESRAGGLVSHGITSVSQRKLVAEWRVDMNREIKCQEMNCCSVPQLCLTL